MLADLFHKLATLTRPTGLPVVRDGRHVWRVSPAGAAVFGRDGPQLTRWVADGLAVVVKANPARTVYRVELPAATVFVKHCRITGPRAWAREWIRPPKARLEFDNATTLRMRGVPAIEPLAWGSNDTRWPGESYLITRGVAAVPFLDFLETEYAALPPAGQRATGQQLTVALAEFFARLHDAGIAHPDPHPGNLLLEMPACRVPRLTLLDLHAVRLGPPLSWHKSRANLALFNRFFQLRAGRPERARFWHHYRRTRASLPLASPAELRAQARELEAETHASNLHLWAKREGRWLGSNRTLRRVKRGDVRGLAVRDVPDYALRSLLENPDAVFAQPGTRVLKDSKTSTVAAFELPSPAGPVPVVLKRVNVRSAAEPLKNFVRRSAVVRSWVNGHTLRDRGLPTPRPLAVFQRYRRGLPAEGYLLTEVVPDAVPLDAAPGAALPRDVLVDLARTLRAMHDRGVSHRDLKASNVLLGRGRDPVLIDLVGVRTVAAIGVARRAKELARLNASFLAAAAVTRGERLRFLLAYLGAGPAFQVGWKSWWELVSRATADKVARNRRVGRALG
ncbi:serine threonine protein kinase : Mn2+-dependent serine/threonine protein kinase OS=Singulisphaera acidiphila (strain ATCC BAA-1392 / DSM 18658 / VKM B-2454 / MOB10) GN=Sinac_2919 PE=4 SV=1: Kdo: Kdo [Gemmataceae bacterium]|nr:serine threonine protein kinase : Mn2+-dependent serine/threonine protein kinase OS=Singulisphaera acidiphila (strain ATCC BAA-1392 / DSM 18658 / VKM B-2454 / MOB10) GN=Sinac_2919 PE=4 SV=1: Kdo: Kdo [Gemmataceae bacterium]VTT96464.1 serine threonine protein kinase : Mn2+-dependent serine/threonine protein kinase OS=Singulisphaera acidiphila (strain ATCC BAA-1392 / DSM 18658 / VKM B-2454 / MOB10) GN=Sinac_2919 PE=4 SV=1: Kdo: Kdo [Gemmataceae bacterium]